MRSIVVYCLTALYNTALTLITNSIPLPACARFATKNIAVNPEADTGMCSFCWFFAKFYWAPDFVENVFGSLSCFNIKIAYPNFTFCGT